MSSISCKRLRQNADSVQQAQAEQVKLNATLTLRREQYKDKNQHYLDLKALCQREETIKDRKLPRPARGG